ncbi:Hypothetical protein DHA2_150152 [Giardia duodenalis]|uniref:Uncharacterized protein n=1 Tax=Giardia intestinalis TaxID=5741 RepID=V6TIP0_GIAIN|nr:Hypothetical protein DHA2_150152 [Giardia intestinalis]
MLNSLTEADVCDKGYCTRIVSELWTLEQGACGDREYLFLCRLLLEPSCITQVDSSGVSTTQLCGLTQDPFCRELASKALSLLLRHGYLRSFLRTLRGVPTPHRCELLALLCSFPCIQEHVVTPMVMETWAIDRAMTLRAIIQLGYNARRHATKPVLDLLDPSTSYNHTITYAQQDLVATALIKLFAFRHLCSVIKDERGEVADRSFRVACLQALARDIKTNASSCDVCATSEFPCSIECPYNCKITVSDTSGCTYTITDDTIVLCYEELCLYLELLHEKLAICENAVWRSLEGPSSHKAHLTTSPSESRRASSRTSRANSLHLGDLDITKHTTNVSASQSMNDEQLDRSGKRLTSSFCQLRTLSDKTYLLLLTSLKSSMQSSNEGVVSSAISAMTSILCSLADSSSTSTSSARVYKRLQSIYAIQFIECVLDAIFHPSDSVKEVAVISLGLLLVRYLQYVHKTVAMGLFYSILNLSTTNQYPKVRNFCLLTIKYVYSNVSISPQDLLLKQEDVQHFITLFSSASSSKLLVAECICLTNREGRQFLMQTARQDINARNRVLCINALKCFAIAAVEEDELIDLKHCLASLLADSSALVQASALDLYGHLYFLVTAEPSEELSQAGARASTSILSDLSSIDKQRLMRFTATPIITAKSFSTTISEKLKDVHFCLNADLLDSLLKVLQDYVSPNIVCALLVDGILLHKKREKVLLPLLNLFSVYQPDNIRGYITLYHDTVEVQIYKLFDKRFPYDSSEAIEYAVGLIAKDSNLISMVMTLSKRRTGSQIFADWCRRILQLMEEVI